MVSVYQIGAILFVAVGVLGSALGLAWRDANRDNRRSAQRLVRARESGRVTPPLRRAAPAAWAGSP